MLTRTLRSLFSHGHKHLTHTQLSAKMGELRKHIKTATEELDALKNQVKHKEAATAQKNKILHEKRVRLTEDVKKSEKVWENAKKQSEAHKSAAIHSFSSNLVSLGDHFHQIKRHQNDSHSIDLREGFENTSRLFFNTLEKFKIKTIQTNTGDKVNKDSVEVVEEVKGAGEKNTVNKVVEAGWEVDGKVIRKPRVVLNA